MQAEFVDFARHIKDAMQLLLSAVPSDFRHAHAAAAFRQGSAPAHLADTNRANNSSAGPLAILAADTTSSDALSSADFNPRSSSSSSTSSSSAAAASSLQRDLQLRSLSARLEQQKLAAAAATAAAEKMGDQLLDAEALVRDASQRFVQRIR